jgi:hypothetical protein
MGCADLSRRRAVVVRFSRARSRYERQGKLVEAAALLADRALSRLLKEDWPRSLEEWEARMGR